jgi:MoaA/NifB/PqqE/SkfB family radical SAM enzyme
MKNRIRNRAAMAALSLALLPGLCLAAEHPGQVDFGKFDPPGKGGEFVEVQIRSNLIGLAARLIEKQEPDAAKLLRSIESVRVNVIGLDEDNRAPMKERVERIRAELAAQGWERVVTAQKAGDDVGVYLKTRGQDAVEGLTVTVIEGGKEAVFVNVVGNVTPEQIAELGERLHVEPLKKIGDKLDKQ